MGLVHSEVMYMYHTVPHGFIIHDNKLSGGSRGHEGRAPLLSVHFLKFSCRFLATIMPNKRLVSPPWERCLIWEIQDPPLILPLLLLLLLKIMPL